MADRTTGTGGKERFDALERPAGELDRKAAWGSDILAETLRALGIEFIALVPGSSFRGLHDSLVNHLGNDAPRLVVCLHEEHAVAIADGYARVTERPMAAALHANVGLMHAAMPIYNAWCDRVPMLIVGATGPVDAHERRPWIDWVHTSRDQGSTVRGYVKWDDQPASVEAGVESLLRAAQLASTRPFAPTYVCFDVSTQEAPLEREVHVPDPRRFAAPALPAAQPAALASLAEALRVARRPLLLYGRMSRSEADWSRRVELAERLGAVVFTSMHNASVFPVEHRQHVLAPCGEHRSEAERALVAQADLIVSADWLDLAGYMRDCTGNSPSQRPIAATIASISLDVTIANGWSMDHQALPAADINILADPDVVIAQLASALGDAPGSSQWTFDRGRWGDAFPSEALYTSAELTLADLSVAMRKLAKARPICLARLPLGWPRGAASFDHPLSYLGKDGGAAVGVGPGNTVGAALALRNDDRLAVAVLGDGDTIMGINALWTAAHLNLPLLVVVANNGSYFNDELHQQRVALRRERPVENRWIGQRLADPEVDIGAMARAQGFIAPAPVRTWEALESTLAEGAAQASAGAQVLIDVRIAPGYAQDFGLEAG